MSETLIVEAELREKTGRAEARRLRRAGKIPGIIYGGDKPDLPVAMDYFKITKLLNNEHFHTSMIEVKVKGKRGKETVLLKETQWDPVKDTIVHLDFQRVSASDTVTVDVPVVPVNFEKCPGVVKGGSVEVIRHTLEVTCRADAIPEHIEIDCADLDLGDTVHIEDVALPDGAEVHHEVNFTVLNIAAPIKAEPADETEEESGEEPAAEEG